VGRENGGVERVMIGLGGLESGERGESGGSEEGGVVLPYIVKMFVARI
jgi:hypothetical protein